MDPALKDRLELAQPFHRGVTQALVAAHHVPLARGLLLLVEHWGLDLRNLPVETTLVPGPLGAHLRLESEGVDVFAGDVATLGDPLGRLELIGQVDVPTLRPPVAV